MKNKDGVESRPMNHNNKAGCSDNNIGSYPNKCSHRKANHAYAMLADRLDVGRW